MKHLYWYLAGIMIWGMTCAVSMAQDKTTLVDEQSVHSLLSSAYQISGSQPTEAQKMAEEALALSEAQGNQLDMMESYFLLSSIYLDLDKKIRALQHAKKGYKIAQQYTDPAWRLRGMELLRDIYEKQGKSNKQNQWALAYALLNDSMQLVTADREISKLKTDREGLQITQDSLQKAQDSLHQYQSRLQRNNDRMEYRLYAAIQTGNTTQAALDSIDQKMRGYREQALARALEIKEQENELLKYNAKVRRQRSWLMLAGFALMSAIAMIIVLVQNARLRKTRAREKEKAQEQLLRHEKMASLGQLTAGIAHEIKNPLNFVNNFAEGSTELAGELQDALSEYQAQPDPEQLALCQTIAHEIKQNASDIKSSGMRIERIVHSMMEHARGNKGTIQSVHINKLVADNLNLAYHGYRGMHPDFNAAIEAEYDPSVGSLQVVPQDLSRALLNIIGNACYALHQKQQQNIPDYISSLKVTTKHVKNKILIIILDNGPGIPKSAQEKIFEPFFTTKPTGAGNTGLGLSISRDIVVQGHNGQLEVRSEPDMFTEFRILLPI